MTRNLIKITDTYGEQMLIPVAHIMQVNLTTCQVLVINHNVPIRCKAGPEWDDLVVKFYEFYEG